LNGNFEKFRLFGNLIFGDPERVQEIADGGWHFIAMGGVDRVIEKIQFQSADELSKSKYWDKTLVMDAINQGLDLFGRGKFWTRYVPIDSTFPITIFRNKEKYNYLIKGIE